jgi:hypothetical protein
MSHDLIIEEIDTAGDASSLAAQATAQSPVARSESKLAGGTGKKRSMGQTAGLTDRRGGQPTI